MLSLYDYLKGRLPRAYRQLERSLEGLGTEDACRGTEPEWRQYRHGAGLDGSIWGIVWHVAAWKHVAADGLDSGVFPDVEAVLPHEPGWMGLLAWLESGQARLVRSLDGLSAADLDRMLTLEGQPMPLYELFSHMIEHDQYHAGQVNLLRQQRGHRFDEGD